MKKAVVDKSTKVESRLTRIARYFFLVVGLVLSFSLIRNTLNFYKSGEKIDKVKEQIGELEEANRELEEKLDWVKSQEYIERESRDKLGLAKEGEIVVVLPDEEILRKLAPERQEKTKSELPKSNWQRWLNLFGFTL